MQNIRGSNLYLQLEAEVQRLKHLLQAKADAKAAKKPTFPANYSLDRTPRTRRKKKRKSPGRTPHVAKRELATHEVALYAPGVSPAACVRHRSQFAWRILDGKAVYVCYHIYDVPESRQLPVPPGLRTRPKTSKRIPSRNCGTPSLTCQRM